MKRVLRIAVLIGLAVMPVLPSAQEQEATERELSELRDAIAALEREQARQIERREDGMAELRATELSLAESRRALSALDRSITQQSDRLEEIMAEQDAANARLSDEQTALAEQVRVSYMTGRQELIRLLLSQDNPADFGRMMVYYDYLNRHRARQIEAVDSELERLGELAAESESVTAELGQLRDEQDRKTRQLAEEQVTRRELIATLDVAIEASGGRIEQMRAEEAELNEIIARLKEMLEDIPVNSNAPFIEEKGQLAPPIRGELVARFGDARDPTGQIRWQGLLLAADAGTPVRAVYQGHVRYADWVTHMGLTLFIDHGDGYLSVYGHNRALTREVGEWVQAGDVIAEVGNSGGQAETALYFSILRDGEPQDPEDWLR